MFSSLGFFSKVVCPKAAECNLLNCIFSHDIQAGKLVDDSTQIETPVFQEYPRKKRKIEASTDRKISPLPLAAEAKQSNLDFETKELTGSGARSKELLSDKTSIKDGAIVTGRVKSCATDKDREALQSISPPPLQREMKKPKKNAIKTKADTGDRPQETLNPRKIPRDPAGHGKRYIYLKKLHEEMTRLNQEAARSTDQSIRALHLTDGEMITLALDEEETIARNSPSTYTNLIKLRMVAYKKMNISQWKSHRLQSDSESNDKSKGAGLGKHKPEDSLSNDATQLTDREALEILRHLAVDQKGLDKHGYVLQPPSNADIDLARSGVEASHGWEQCARCQSRFQVYPSRREDGSLTSGGKCTYHYGRLILGSKDNAARTRIQAAKVFSCCGEAVGSSRGCAEAGAHVFKTDDPKRLASVMPFVKTPENISSNLPGAVCFDCEMGYTVLGMELIRLTAVDWPKGKLLLDVLVRPHGAILDFNTRFSGVTRDDFLSAPAFSAEGFQVKSKGSSREPSHGTPESGPGQKSIPIVESPDDARELLFKHISPQTPLIGHAIENDLNAVRIVHPCIVDTIILFPHPAGLPRRRPLKGLAKEILSRDIQTGGSAGHDSLEDAKATADLVRVKMARKWEEMKCQGWTFKDDVLVASIAGNDKK